MNTVLQSLTQMEREAREAPSVILAQIRQNKAIIEALVDRLKHSVPPCVMTVARGSSDHAATFAKYLIETCLGIPTVSAAPSVFTLYQRKLRLKDALVIAISQSGQSVDLYDTLQAARESGALTVALINQTSSPLAEAAEYVLPLHAEEEFAIAATKSTLASLAALIGLVAAWGKDKVLQQALAALPNALEKVLAADWPEFSEAFREVKTAFVIGRGYGFPIAQEAALKFKETCGLHAEAFSSAEILHGPFALIEKTCRVLLIGQSDETLPGTLALADRIHASGGKSLLCVPEALHPICDPLIALQTFYPAVARLAEARGLNPDSPPHLQKVTITR